MDTANKPKVKPEQPKETAKTKKEETWMKPRHKTVRNLVACVLNPYSALKYGIKIEKFKEQNGRQYLVLFNHQTAFDQFFVGASFDGPIYYLASEDLFSNGWVSSLIRYLVAPIPIKKQTTDVKAILNCIRVSKEGGSIAIAPEGNRTYCGRSVYMSNSIVPLAKKLGMPIALYRIEGGYGVHPRWSDVVRKGRMHAYVSRVIYPEEYKEMSDEALFEAIKQELYVNEAVADAEFYHKRSAEYLERALYVCPNCGLSTFESNGDRISCKKCGLTARYTPKKTFEGVDGQAFPFTFVADWYDAQSLFINSLDVTKLCDEALYTEDVRLSEVIPYKRKEPISDEVRISLYGNRIEAAWGGETCVFLFDEVSAVTVLGKNKLNIYHGGKIYQVKGDKRFNALKYVHFYNRCKNILKGEENGEFLGL